MSAQDEILSRIEYDTNGGCWLWARSTVPGGYGKLRRVRSHRASYEAFKGPIPDGLFVCHKCDVPACVNPDHLFLGTSRDNIDDMVAKGRQCRWNGRREGHQNPRAKITEDQARAILHSSDSRAALVAQYGLSPAAICYIKRRVTWKHLT